MDFQVLQCFSGFTEATALDDLYIWRQGRLRFNREFGGQIKEHRSLPYYYAPLISLSLGRLAKAGLVTKSQDPNCNWYITKEGQELLKEISGVN